MITTLLIAALAGLASLLWLLVPDIPVPDWLTNQSGVLGSMLHGVRALNEFVPLALAVTVLGAVLLVAGIAVGIRIVRMIISHVTGGGGAT